MLLKVGCTAAFFFQHGQVQLDRCRGVAEFVTQTPDQIGQGIFVCHLRHSFAPFLQSV